MALAIVVVCTLLLLVGVAMAVAWGGQAVKGPSEAVSRAGPPVASSASPVDGTVNVQVSALRRYLWWANVATVAALASGVLVAGAGGRLVMRVLAVTSPDSAQGRLTEALATVGFPTVGGSIALFIFGGLPAGFAAAFVYLLIHRWLPAGRWAGPLLGVFLLLLFGASVEPLRVDNIDFAIVGPGWLSVLLFSMLAVLHGAVVAAVAGAFSRRLPLPFKKNWKYYLPLLAAILFVPAGIVLAVGALAVMVWSRLVPAGWGTQRSAAAATSGASGTALPAAARRRTAVTWAGPGLLGVAAIAALPLFISAVTSIVSR